MDGLANGAETPSGGCVLKPDFERLFNALGSPYMVLDREFRYVTANPAYEAAVMRSINTLRGVNVFDAFPSPGEGERRLRASFRRVIETGQEDVIAYIPYDILRSEADGGGFDRRFWTATHTPLKRDDGFVEYIVQNTVDVTELVRLKEATAIPFRIQRDEGVLIERARQADRAREALLSQSEDFRRLFQQAPGFMAVLSGPDHVFTFANDAYLRLVGGRNVIGLTVGKALPEVEGQGFIQMLDEVYSTGQERGAEGARVLLRDDHDGMRETFLDFSYKPVRDGAGQINGIFVQGMDRTESFKAERAQRLLVDELNHRVKNTLATVQSIAAQTLRAAPDVSTARAAFEARIIALSKAHNILSERQWSDADLKTLVTRELAAYGAERVETDGPSVMLNPKAAIATAMVIHELATNAAKHGALLRDSGKVSVMWSLADAPVGPELGIVWRESGGAAVSPPTHTGFGSRMIERAVAGELTGRLERDYGPSGFWCRITVPFDAYGRTENAFAR